MTRDEAVNVLGAEMRRNMTVVTRDLINAHVDGLAALGLLKFDEPKDAATCFAEMATGYLSKQSAISLMVQMEERGLKVVFK